MDEIIALSSVFAGSGISGVGLVLIGSMIIRSLGEACDLFQSVFVVAFGLIMVGGGEVLGDQAHFYSSASARIAVELASVKPLVILGCLSVLIKPFMGTFLRN